MKKYPWEIFPDPDLMMRLGDDEDERRYIASCFFQNKQARQNSGLGYVWHTALARHVATL